MCSSDQEVDQISCRGFHGTDGRHWPKYINKNLILQKHNSGFNQSLINHCHYHYPLDQKFSLCLLTLIEEVCIITTAEGTYWSSVFRFKSKFLACHILDFYKNFVFPSEQFPTLSHTHTQQVVSIFGTTYCCKQLFFKIKHAKSILHSQLSNHHLLNVILLSNSSFNHNITSFWLQITKCLINKLWLLPCKFNREWVLLR